MRLSKLLLASAALLCSLPVHAALIVSLDQPVQVVAPGGVAAFSGTILNTGPEILGLGVSPEFVPDPSPPFTLGLAVGLLDFHPGPGEQYTGPIFAIFVDPSAAAGDNYIGVLTVRGDPLGGAPVFSNDFTFYVVVGEVPEPGSAVLLGIPVLGLMALRRRRQCLPVMR